MRTVKKIHKAYRDDIQDLRTQRPLPSENLSQLDPFLFLNHHGPQVYKPQNRGLPFGPHPHRGFETLTIILEGDIAHYDSAGHESVIGPGGIQWMTAGRGLIHSEVSSAQFKAHGGPLEILQLWINLPAKLKMTDPHYVGLQKENIPSIPLDDSLTMNLFSGNFLGHRGPIKSLTDVTMMALEIAPAGHFELPAPQHKTIFCYVVRGEVSLSSTTVSAQHLIELNADGDSLTLSCSQGAVIIYGLADPINEPMVSYGPFVMNTKKEIEEAIQDYQEGRLK